MDNLAAFYITMGVFFGTYGITSVMIIGSLSFIYGIDVGRKAENLMYFVFAASAMLMMVWDCCIWTDLGLQFTVLIIGIINFVIVIIYFMFNLHIDR